MKKTNIALFFCLTIAAIMCQMGIDAGPDDKTFRVSNTGVRQATGHQRTQAASKRSPAQKTHQTYGRQGNRVRQQEGQRSKGPCRGDRCPAAVTTPAPQTTSSSYSSSYGYGSSYYDEE